MIRTAALGLMLVSGCSSAPPPVAVPIPVIVRIEPPPRPKGPVLRAPLPAVAPSVVATDLAVANTHLHEADRYVAWNRSRVRVVDNLTPLTAAVARAAHRVEADRHRHHVSPADDAQLRRATMALADYLQAKGD